MVMFAFVIAPVIFVLSGMNTDGSVFINIILRSQ